MVKERVALWDNLKLLLITAVVLGHFADFFTKESGVCRALFLFIYAFHMPVFFFISGLFYSEKNAGRKSLFYFSGGVLIRIFLAAFSRIYGNVTPSFPLFKEDGLPWFLYALAAYTALTYLLRRQNKLYLLGAAALLGCFVGYDATVGDTLCLSRIIVFLPFYLLGVCSDRTRLLSFRQRHRLLILPALITVTGWAAACFLLTDRLYKYRHLFTGRFPFSDAVVPYGPLARLGCYLLAALLGAALIVLAPARRIKGVTALGENSLNVYFWHWIVYMTLERFLHVRRLFSFGFWGKTGFLLIAVAITAVLAAVPVFKFPLQQVRAAVFRSDGERKECDQG